MVALSASELSELPVGRAGGRAAVSVLDGVELGSSSVSVDASVVSEGDSVIVTVVAAVTVPILVVPGAVSVTVFSIVVVYVVPPLATATALVCCSLVVELGSWLVRPEVTVEVGRTVVVVCVLTQTHPTS